MILENKEYDVKNKITCDCGYEFKTSDMTDLKRIKQSGFYGNNIKHYSHAKCKNCNKEVLLLIKQKGQIWQILDIALEKNKTNKLEGQISNEKSIGNELICPICKKECKNKPGLTSHMKSHQNK